MKKGIINPRLTEMRARSNGHKLLQVTFQLAVQKPHNDRVAVHRDGSISVHFRTQPEKQHDLTFKLALLTPNKFKKKSLASVSSCSKKAKRNLIQLKKQNKTIRKFKIKK